MKVAKQIVAIEIDPVLVEYLRSKYDHEPRVKIIQSDVLKADLTQWGSMVVAGNIPYYITSPIVERVLSLRGLVRRAVFLVQKEVAERIVSGPGSRDYGYLSVATQFYAETELLFTVPPGAFRPPPKVDSAVVRLIPRAARASLAIANPERFLKFVGMCFRQKRKTLRNNLLGAYDDARLRGLPESGKRAEQLSLADLQRLFETLNTAGYDGGQ